MMKPDSDELKRGFGLLACGSSGGWSIDLDESTDGTELSLQLDGPQVYLAFVVRELGAIRDAHDYLRAEQPQPQALSLGSFGSGTVSLHWDNEEIRRCFLIISTQGSAVRVTLSAEDTASLVEALEQVAADIPPEAKVGQEPRIKPV